MIHYKLRLAAAKFALDLANITDLVDASHAALDDAVYADGLAVIATTPNMQVLEAGPHFIDALRDLGHTFTSQGDALRYLRLRYLGPVAEGIDTPIDGIERFDRTFYGVMSHSDLGSLAAWRNPSSREVTDHLLDREIRWSEGLVQLDGMTPAQLEDDWKERAIELCRDWCREYGRLYLQPAWRSPTVVALAAGIHAERAFDRLPILADALEEAGCDHPDLLAHCRTPSPHTDYCWLVDLLLGKS